MQILHPVLPGQSKESTARWAFLNGRSLKALVVLAVSLVVGMVIAFGILNLKPPAALRDGQQLARAIAKSAVRSDSVPVASGTYVPGNGIILYSQVAYDSDTQIYLWLATQLQAQSDRLAQLPAGEMLTWVVDYRLPAGQDPELAEQKVLQVPLNQAGNPALYRYIDSPAVTTAAPLTQIPAFEPAAVAPVEAAAPAAAVVTEQPVEAQAVQVVAEQPVPAPAAQIVVEPPVQPQAVQVAVPAGALPAAEAPALVADAAGMAPLVDPVSQDTPLFGSDFTENDAGWRSLSGEWQVVDGAYRQNNAAGYDFISMIDTNRLADYSLQARFRFAEGEMGGGFIYHAPSMDNRAGAQSIDFTDNGGFLRWGYYDKATHYNYVGGAQIDPPVSDGQWHTLRLVTHTDQTTVYLDDQKVAVVIDNINRSGHVGLTTSQAQIDFDDVSLVLLPPNSKNN